MPFRSLGPQVAQLLVGVCSLVRALFGCDEEIE